MTFRQQMDRWLSATTLSSAKAGAIAVKAFAGVSVASNLGVPVAPLDPKQLGVIFLGGFFWHFNDCLASIPSPLPEPTAGTAALPGATSTNPNK